EGDAVGLVVAAIGTTPGPAVDPVADDLVALDRPVEDRKAPPRPAGTGGHVTPVVRGADLIAAARHDRHGTGIRTGVQAVAVIELVGNSGPLVGPLGLLEGLRQAPDGRFNFRAWIGHGYSFVAYFS